jgi:hypothetical protein
MRSSCGAHAIPPRCSCHAALLGRVGRGSPGGKGALTTGSVGEGGARWLNAVAEERKEGVQVIGEEVRVCERSAAARVDLYNTRVETEQAECAAGVGQETVTSCRHFAQQTAARCLAAACC